MTLPLEKFIRIAEKWIENKTDQNMDEHVIELAYLHATETSDCIVCELGNLSPETSDYLKTWIKIGSFAGFIGGWGNHKSIPVVYPTLEQITDYSQSYANRVAEQIFWNLTKPPVSPIIKGFDSQELAFMKETLTRSLFTGCREGTKQALLATHDLANIDFTTNLHA